MWLERPFWQSSGAASPAGDSLGITLGRRRVPRSAWSQRHPRAEASMVGPGFQRRTARLREAGRPAQRSTGCGQGAAHMRLAGTRYRAERGFCDEVAFSAPGGVCREGCLSLQVKGGASGHLLAHMLPCSPGLLAVMHPSCKQPRVSVVSVGSGTTLALGCNPHALARTGRPLPWSKKAGKLLGQRPLSEVAWHGQRMEETPALSYAPHIP